MVVQMLLFGLYVIVLGSSVSALLMFFYIQSDQAERYAKQEAENTQLRMEIMLSQIQPHFLYNTFGTIGHLCQSNPEAVCTRAQMVTFLWPAAGRPEPVSTEQPFSDLEEASYYFKAVLWAFENGITFGNSDTTFGPNDLVTRGQAVTFLFRALNAAAGEENPFTDVRKEAFYYNAVLWAYENGVTKGNGDTTFGPLDACLRAHIVTFLYRAYGGA